MSQRRPRRDQDAGLIEYALIVALIIVIVAGVVIFFEPQIAAFLQQLGTQL